MTPRYAIQVTGTRNGFIGYDEASGGYPYVGDLSSRCAISATIPEIPSDIYLKEAVMEVVEVRTRKINPRPFTARTYKGKMSKTEKMYEICGPDGEVLPLLPMKEQDAINAIHLLRLGYDA